MPSTYTQWLEKKGTPVFHGAGIEWQEYCGALVPATIKPVFLEPSPEVLRSLLRQSGLPFARYTSGPSATPTAWWYIVCDHYDKALLSSKTRNQIKRGYRNYSVRLVDCVWLAQHGYQCCIAAASRYANYSPVSEKEFRNHLISMAEGPMEYWGVFSSEKLVGYAVFVREDDAVIIATLKFDPEHLKEYCAYVLFDGILNHYVTNRGFLVNNGNRPVSHDTNIHDFLLKFGFKPWYGQLRVVYQPWLALLTRLAYPFRELIERLPISPRQQKISALLRQEVIRRQCLLARPGTKGASDGT